MKINRYDLPIHPMEYDTPNMVFGNWCRAIDVAKLEESYAELQANTIPIPSVRVEDEGSPFIYGGSDRWSVYLNLRCIGIHSDRENALNQAEYIKLALGITQ